MLVAGVSFLFLGIQLSAVEVLAIAAIGIGIMSLVFVRGSEGMCNPRAATLALITGCFIASYSLVDGYGARKAGTALGFYGWLAIVNAIVFALITAFFKAGVLGQLARNGLKIALFGGGASFIAYSLVIWAFTKAPIALVTALRETSIIFALLIGVFFLKERLNLVKVISTALTVLGAFLLRVSR
jgi:drug/metabolite transporter (DMT)-like permease